MKKIFAFTIMAILLMTSASWGYGIVTNTSTRDTLQFPCNPLDSLGSPVNLASGDSIYVMVVFPGGAVAYRDSMAWDDASIIRFGWEDFAETTYTFQERVSVIDGAGVDGVYRWFVKIQDLTGAALTTQYTGQFQVVNSTLESSLDSAGLAAIRSGQALDSLADILDSLETMSTWIQDSLYAVLDSLQNQDNWVAQAASFDSSIAYLDHQGPGIFIDSAAGNTNTVIGTDGTRKNPVSTFVAARTLADALGYKRYYLINRSTFNDAANDLSADHQDFQFIGIGHQSAMAFGSQNVSGSRFLRLTLSGAMHASGGDLLFEKCILDYISANFTGHTWESEIRDTLVLKNATDIELNACYSGVAGNGAPTLDFGAGNTMANIRHQSGGLRVMNGSSGDIVSIETDGQTIISSNNTSLNITLRGMMSVTDSGTTTNLTDDAVFSRQDWEFAGDSMSNRGIVQYDSSQATLQLTQLVVSNSGGDAVQFTSLGSNGHGLKLTGDGTGEGLSSNGGSDGHGAHFLGGSTMGSGLFAQATGDNNSGATFQGFGTGHGLFAISGGGATGNGMQTTAASTNGNGIGLTATGTGVEITSDDLVDLIWDEDTTGHKTDPNMGFFITQGGEASITDADMASIGDTVLGKVISGFTGIPGSLGDVLLDTLDALVSSAGGVASISDADMAAFMDSMSNRGIVQYDSTQAILQMAGLKLRASGDDTAFVAVASASGSGHGAYFGAGLTAGTGHGFYTRGGVGAGGTVGHFSLSSGASGFGALYQSTGTGSVGFKADGLTRGFEAAGSDSSGYGFFAHSTFGDGMQLTAGSGNSKHGLEIQGGSGSGGDAVALRADGADAMGISIWSDDSTGVQIIGSVTSGDGDGMHITLGQGSGNGLVIDSHVVINDSLKADLRSALNGDGSENVTIVLVDSSGVDAAVSGVKLTIKTLTGEPLYQQNTLSNGTRLFNLDQDSFTIVSFKAGYVWEALDTIVVSGTQTDTVWGYNVAIGSPAGADLCRVYGFAQDIQGNLIEGFEVTASLRASRAQDSCNGTILDGFERRVSSAVTTGLWQIDLVKSKCIDATKNEYQFIGTYPGGTQAFRINFTVPDQDSVKLSW